MRPWTEYRTIMWIGSSAYKKPEKLPLFFQRLREMGVNTAVAHGSADPQPILENGFPFYVENMVNRGLCLKWNSPVTDWEKHVREWAKTRDEAGLIRPYSLDDPQWRTQARKTVQAIVRKQMPHRPLAYDLRDELSTTISANPFDYDFSPTALAAFRDWLKTRYPSLEALNAQWQTHFASWDEVKPFTTDRIKNRMASGEAMPRGQPDWQALRKLQFDPAAARQESTRWNFSPWADHRTYMDVSLASTLRDLRAAVRELDPHTPVGIEGTQMPAAFGGYDLWRLSQVLDWVEPYDIGNAREIFGSFMPGKPILTTVGERDASAARRRLWHLLLSGDKGCLIWWSEDCIDWASDDYALTPRAQALAPVLKEMTSPLAQLFLRAEREIDPIAIHYSQPSIQVNWLLESTVDGASWLRRFSSHEAAHNRMARRRQAWVKLIQDAGYTPRFVSSEQIERGELENARILVLPDSLALSDAELERISGFLAAPAVPRLLLGSGAPGVFDHRGRLRAAYAFEPLKGVVDPGAAGVWFSARSPRGHSRGTLGGDIADELALRKGVVEELPSGGQRDGTNPFEGMSEKEQREHLSALLGQLLTDQIWGALPPPVRVPRRANIQTHRYRLGPATLLAFERNIVWQMSEDLKQSGGNEALEKPIRFEATLAAPGHLYDLRTGAYLGHRASIPVALDPWQPSLYALLPEQIPAGRLMDELAKAAAPR